MTAPIEALICPRCGAPLPIDLVTHPRCAFCGVGVAFRTGTLHVTSDVAGAPHPPFDPQAFFDAIHSALRAGRSPQDAVRAAAAEHLGALGESDGVARVTLALARDVERESGASIRADGNALARIAQAYVKALPELREKQSAEMNLPFLAATDAGPIHLARRLTPASIAELLVAKEETSPRRPAQEERGEKAPAEKKRGWWPFGR